MHSIEAALVNAVTQVYGAIGWPGVVLLMVIESAGIPFPSELIMPLAGWLLIQDRGGPVWLVVLAGFYGALGNLLGSWLGYWVSLKGGRPLLRKYGKYVLLTEREVDQAEAWFGKYGEWAVFFSRLLPIARTFISIPAGIARMNLWKFSVYTFTGSFPWSLGLTFGGYLLGAHWGRVRSVMRPFDIPALLLLAVLMIWFIWRRVKTMRIQHVAESLSRPNQPPERGA